MFYQSQLLRPFHYKYYSCKTHTFFLESFQQEKARRKINNIFYFQNTKYNKYASSRHTCKPYSAPLLLISMSVQTFFRFKERHNPLWYTLYIDWLFHSKGLENEKAKQGNKIIQSSFYKWKTESERNIKRLFRNLTADLGIESMFLELSPIIHNTIYTPKKMPTSSATGGKYIYFYFVKKITFFS